MHVKWHSGLFELFNNLFSSLGVQLLAMEELPATLRSKSRVKILSFDESLLIQSLFECTPAEYNLELLFAETITFEFSR